MMSEPNSETKAAAAAPADERLKSASTLQRLLSRPELGAVSGLVLITIFFVSTANSAMFTAAGIMNFMAPASQLGILAVAAALLMIGGEFDLSIGSMVAFAGLILPQPCRLAGAACRCHYRYLAVCGAGGGGECADRHQNGSAVLYRHAGLSLHIARPFACRAEVGNRRFDAAARCEGSGQRQLSGRPLFRRCISGAFRMAGGKGFDCEISKWRAGSERCAGRGAVVCRDCPCRDLYSGAHPLRQLDFCGGRRCACRAQFRCSGAPRQNHALHVHGHGGSTCGYPDCSRCRVHRCTARFPERIRGQSSRP